MRAYEYEICYKSAYLREAISVLGAPEGRQARSTRPIASWDDQDSSPTRLISYVM